MAVLLGLTPAPAHAQGPVCVPPPAPDPLQQAIAARREYGFNTDPAYVRTLKRTYDSLDTGPLPVSAAEARYLRARERLSPLGAAERRYVRSLGDDYAGYRLTDAWPHPAYLLVHFTRDPHGHLAGLKRVARFPQALRADRVRYTLRTLGRLQDRVSDDDRALQRAGFQLETVSVDEDTNRVEVELVTARDDAAAYFRKRYGPVRTEVIAREPTKLECNHAGSFTIAPDGMSLTIAWGTGGGAKTERIEVTESADRVDIGIVERVPVGARTLELIPAQAVAALSQPLAGRAVYDASNGKRILQNGPSPGDPPCPARPEQSELERVIEERSEYGMRADPAYVQSLLDDDREYTEPERRWVKSVDRLAFDQRIDDYTTHYRKDWGGTAVIADYPAKPYLLIRLTKRLTFHTRALKRLARRPDEIRTVRAVHTADELYETADRINQDALAGDGFIDGYGRAGFRVLGANGHDQTADVEVDVITTRSDAAAYFAAHYGDYVKVEVVGDRFECALTAG